MKNKLYALMLASTTLVGFTGCEDFLNTVPELYLVDEDIYSTPERIDGAVLGVYAKLKERFIGSKAYCCVENIGDDMINVSGNGIEALYSYYMTVGLSTQDNYQTWEAAYAAINSANTVLAGVEANAEVLGDKVPAVMAELKFCRALSYYYLNMLYANPYVLEPDGQSVPLRLIAENSLEGNNLAPSTTKEVFNQILEDTKDYDLLPNAPATEAGITRASRAAALMLRMRVYMAMEDWDNAIAAGNAITGYKLSSSVAEPFASSPSCMESIFSFAMAETNNGGGGQVSTSYFYCSGNSLVMDRMSGIQSALYPNYSLGADDRYTLLTGIGSNDQVISKKFVDGETYLDWVPIFRYAETLLNLSESYAMKGMEAEAISALSAVRSRSIDPAVDPLDVTTLSGDALVEAIYLERRAEFVGEAMRSLDIHRRGEDFVKQQTTVNKFVVTPTTSGYIWPIPTVERAHNNLIPD